MAGDLKEAIGFFVDQVFANETLTNDEKKAMVKNAMRSLAGAITDGQQKWGMSLVIGQAAQDAGRRASGMNGLQAKAAYFQKLREENDKA